MSTAPVEMSTRRLFWVKMARCSFAAVLSVIAVNALLGGLPSPCGPHGFVDFFKQASGQSQILLSLILSTRDFWFGALVLFFLYGLPAAAGFGLMGLFPTRANWPIYLALVCTAAFVVAGFGVYENNSRRPTSACMSD